MRRGKALSSANHVYTNWQLQRLRKTQKKKDYIQNNAILAQLPRKIGKKEATSEKTTAQLPLFRVLKRAYCFACLAFSWTSKSPSPTLAFLGVRERRRVVDEVPNAPGPSTWQGAANGPLHQGIAVGPRVLGQLGLV